MTRSRRRRINNWEQRNNPYITSGHLYLKPLLRRNVLPLHEIVDNRRYRPRISSIPRSVLVSRPLRNTKGKVAKVSYGINLRTPSGFIIHAARDAVICVRRKIRREVLFAFGGAGGRASRKFKHLNEHSKVHC